MIFNVIGAALGIGSAVAGVVGGAQSDAAERKAVKRQNEYNQDVYDYEWDEYLRRFEYDEESLEIRKRNEEAQFAYSDETAKRRYQYDLAINQYSFDLANEQYNKSVENYKQNLTFNNIAAARAYEQESRRFDDVATQSRFDKQDQEIQAIQERGSARARGVAGGSASRAKQMTLGSLGRNMAIIDRQMSNAKQQSWANLRQIAAQKYGEDIRAFNDVLLKPTKQPDVMAPLTAPRPEYQDLFKREKPPEPVEGVAYGGGLLSGIGNALNTASSLAFRMPSSPSQNIIPRG